MDVKYIQRELSDFAKKRNWEKFHNLKNLAISINIESSELLEIFQWDDNKQLDEKINKKQFKERVSDEVADVFIYLIAFCNENDIDIKQAIDQKMKKNKKKYPANIFKGRF